MARRSARAATQPVVDRTGSIVGAAVFAAAVVALLILTRKNHAVGLDHAAIWVGLAGTAAGAWLAITRKDFIRPSRLAWSAIAFVGWALIAALASGRFWSAMVGEFTNRLGWMTIAAIALLGVIASLHSEQVRSMLRRYAWLVVVVEVLAVAARYGHVQNSMLAGTLSNPTYLGEAFVLLLPWVLPDDTVRRTWERYARYATILVAIGVLVISQSRAALVVALVWVGWVIFRQWDTRRTVKLAAAGGVLVAVAAAIFAFVPNRLLSSDGPLAFGGRFELWSLAAQALARRPITGWGPDGFWPGAARLRTIEAATRGHSLPFGAGATDPHNVIVWLAVSTGVVGLGLFLWFAWEVVRVWRGRARDGHDVSTPAWSLLGCVVVALSAPVPLNVWPLFAVVLGASLPAGALAAAGDDDRARPAVRGLSLAVAIALGLSSAVFAANAVSRATYEEGGPAVSPKLAPGAVAASRRWSFDPHLSYLAASHARLAAVADPSQDWNAVARASIERAAQTDPLEPFYALERARFYKYGGAAPEAVDAAFAEAFSRYPAYPVARAEYAEYLATTDRVSEARAHLVSVRAIDDTDPERLAAMEAAEKALSAAGD